MFQGVKTQAIYRNIAALLIYSFVIFAFVGCNSKTQQSTIDNNFFTEKLDARTTEESIFISDKDGNRLARQSAKSRDTIWVAGSFRYSSKKSDLPSFIIDISRNNSQGKPVSYGSKTGKFKFIEDSDRVVFLVDIILPLQTGEFILYAKIRGKKFVESKITVVK